MAPSHQPQLTLQHRPSVLAGCLTASVVALPLAPAFGVVLAAGALSRTHDRHDESVAGSADSASLTILPSALPGTNGLALLVWTRLSVIALPKEALPKEPLPRLGPMATGPPQLSWSRFPRGDLHLLINGANSLARLGSLDTLPTSREVCRPWLSARAFHRRLDIGQDRSDCNDFGRQIGHDQGQIVPPLEPWADAAAAAITSGLAAGSGC